MRKVVKFGGSSLANAEQFEKVGDIIRSEESRRFVVPSAPGKRFDGDTKVTDLLYSCYDAAANGGDFEKVLEEIKKIDATNKVSTVEVMPIIAKIIDETEIQDTNAVTTVSL